MSRERRLSSPASPCLQSLQPASHTHRGTPTPLHYFALNPIIDKFSFTVACHLGSSGQHKAGRHVIRYTVQPEQMQNIY
jgi:hypothetical protein